MPAAKKKTGTPEGAGNIFLFVGNDEGQVQDAARIKVNELAGPDADEFGLEIIEGSSENSGDAAKIIGLTTEALLTLPFFGSKVVWLKGANFVADSVTGRAEATLNALESLTAALVEGIPDGVQFVMSASEIDKRRSFYKQIAKRAKVEVYDKPDIGKAGWELKVMQRVEEWSVEAGLTFKGRSMRNFVMKAGENSRQLRSEFDKLQVYLGDRKEVTSKDVREIVSLTRGGVVFEIGNALENRRASDAIGLIDHLLNRGENAVGILLAAIVPKIRTMVQGRDLMDRFRLRPSGFPSFNKALNSLPESEQALLPRSKEGKIIGYPLFFSCKAAENFSMPELRRALDACLDANLKMVTSGMDHRLLLHRLVVEILAGES